MEYLTAAEVADIFMVQKEWIYQQTRLGLIPHLKVGRYYRYRREAIEQWARKQEERGSS